jgi:UDP:flavonoid glycosyltransferase YjiC (YdhE family)
VRVEQWVNEAEVLPHASAAVGHGGSGTTMSALAAGCPLVVVPLFGDQPYNAIRVAVAGPGVVAPVDSIGPRIELVLANDGYRAVVRRVADEMRALPPVDGFLDLA